jgi:hypothetical protein
VSVCGSWCHSKWMTDTLQLPVFETAQRPFVVLPDSFSDNIEALVICNLLRSPVTAFCSDRSSRHLQL